MKPGPWPRILVTGFEPFGELRINSSQSLVESLASDPPAGIDLVTEILPTEFEASGARVVQLLSDESIRGYLALGVAGDTASIRLERVAVNLQQTVIADNAGRQPQGLPIVSGGVAAYLTTLPTANLHAALTAASIPAQISRSAGTFVCNHVFYVALRKLIDRATHLPLGFIHLPHLSQEAAGRGPAGGSMPLSTMRRGIEIALDVVCEAIAYSDRSS